MLYLNLSILVKIENIHSCNYNREICASLFQTLIRNQAAPDFSSTLKTLQLNKLPECQTLKTNSKKFFIQGFFFSMQLSPQRAALNHTQNTSLPKSRASPEHQRRGRCSLAPCQCRMSSDAAAFWQQQQSTRLTFSLGAHVLLGRNTMAPPKGASRTQSCKSFQRGKKPLSSFAFDVSGWAQTFAGEFAVTSVVFCVVLQFCSHF